MNLLTLAASNTKLRKTNGETQGYRIVSLPLAPADSSGHEVCQNSSPGCRQSCVANLGLASVFPMILRQRREKTRFFFEQKEAAIAQLCKEIEHQALIAEDAGLQLAIRANVFSDLVWESKRWNCLPQRYPNVCWYDYSKLYFRAPHLPDNYSICWSFTEREKDQRECHRLLLAGENCAMVFGTHGRGFTGPRAYDQQLPGWTDIFGDRFMVYDGDRSDLRVKGIDPGPTTSGRGRVCGLRLKASNNIGHEAGLDSQFAREI